MDGSASSDPEGPATHLPMGLRQRRRFRRTGGAYRRLPLVSWETLKYFDINDNASYTIGLRVTDDRAQFDTTTTTLVVNNVAPTLTTTGAATVGDGGLYTLNLSAVDPGNDTITGWTINWGDGTIDAIAGNPAAVNHAYSGAGFTYNILASASDEDGTYLQNELLVPSYAAGDSIFRYAETTGAFLQEFATVDGLDNPIQVLIGPDGNLYVTGEASKNVLRYDAETGVFIDEFVLPAVAG